MTLPMITLIIQLRPMSNMNQEEQVAQNCQEEQPQPAQDYEDQFMNGPEFQEHAEEIRNKELLECLAFNTVNSKTDKERLMFQALYSLKKMEMDLNQKMVKEIELVKDKYQLLKQPLYVEISNAALGKPVRKELYQYKEKNSQIVAKRIPDFWQVVMTKAGILNDQIAVDLDCFQHLSSFTCQFVEGNFNFYKICFSFKQAPQYFSNKNLEISIKMGSEDQEAVCTIPQPIRYKMAKVEASLFTQLFDNPNLQEVGYLATEINQCHRNSLYFYFSKHHTRSSSSSSQVDEDSLPLPNNQSPKKLKSEGSGSKTETLIQHDQ